MRVKPKEIMVVLPAAHLFQSEEEMAQFASAINTIIHGKVKIKYEMLGQLGGQCVGLFYIQRNNESQLIHDEFRRLIEQEEMNAHSIESPNVCDEELDMNDGADDLHEPFIEHALCIECDVYGMLHQKGLDHCICGEDWIDGRCESQGDK